MLPKAIQDAIDAGKKAHQEILDAKKLAEEFQARMRQEQREKYAAEAKVWAALILPTLIEQETAKGKTMFDLGSCDHDRESAAPYRANACRAIGLRVTEQSYQADPGEEGMYAHGSGRTYYVHW